LPDGSFQVRGPGYLKDKVKVPSEAAAFEPVSVTAIDADRVLFNVCARLKPLKAFLAANTQESYLVTNRACPVGKGRVRNIITVARRTLPAGSDPSFDLAFSGYVAGDHDHKNLRMKYLPRLSSAPWLLLSAVNVMGGQRPVIMGKGYLTQQHLVGENYLEVSVDISSSKVAKKIAG